MMTVQLIPLLLATILFVTSHAAPGLEQYGADGNQVSVSGLSAGGFVAVQVHVAYSASIMGVGVVAGGPYWCARRSLFYSLTQCTLTGNINVNYLAGWVTTYAYIFNSIDNPANMANDKIYVFHGSMDSVVHEDVTKAAEEYYQHFNTDNDNFLTEYTVPAEHSMVHDVHGNACGYKGIPNINNCGYNTAYEMLNHFYGPGLQRPTATTSQDGDLLEFDQTEFFPYGNPGLESVANTGYVYVPTGCLVDASLCRVHLALHGCLQQYGLIGDQYTTLSGYNEVGELNDIIVIYPQATSTPFGGNPGACWDWWGYASYSYASNLAPQMDFMKQIIDRVTA
ncbi:uncharacterized protein LOC100888183 [Strongylocentrotus purpuratus]|uniref:Polyhydroxybutyrate depolymerase n=1 Tax=Strongylocentrotus purpuratus TaxID=7668 RepID=A0A7M7NCP5_STRPU|nr:uncharacterized protein LOC100888183 [Strongylocentrotus purpuratus]